MSSYADRLAALRAQLAADRLDGFVVPLTDEHMSEYVGSYAQRLEWLTGFKGSAGAAAVLPEEAAIFTDGRYTIQVRQQVSATEWSYQSVPQTSIAEWLAANAPDGARIGYDPWLHSRDWVKAATAALKAKGARAGRGRRATRSTAVWTDRPAPSAARLVVQPEALAGKSSAQKRHEVADWLTEKKADAAVLAALDSIAWTFNVRGADVSHTPVALAFAVVHADGTADLFVAGDKVGDDVRAHLGNGVRLHERDAFEPYLRGLSGKTVAVDPERSVAAITQALEAAGATILDARDPVGAGQGGQERRRDRRAQGRAGARRRGDRQVPALDRGGRRFGQDRRDQRRANISRRCGARPGRSRICRSTRFRPWGPMARCRIMAGPPTGRWRRGRLFLCDSGGQYQDGTTDITRTVPLGEPTDEMRDRFTRVLKGHIAIATALFPKGTRGSQLDSFARRPLWEAGCDYAHGTGHGVGAFLSVHEGPQRISPVGSSQPGGDEPLLAGMILSATSRAITRTATMASGSRIWCWWSRKQVAGADKEMLGFETLTFAPIDRRLIVADDAERCRGRVARRLSCRGAGRDRPAARGGRQDMARNAMRAARALNWAAVGWMTLGAVLTAMWILGPRVAVNRALDAGYSLAGWVSSFF